MNTLKLLLFVSCTAVLLLGGCAQEQEFKAVEQICVPNMSKAEAMQTAEDVLGKMHFPIDKSDAELGVIRSRPLQGAQFFEFWRRDNVGAFNSAEASLHSVRRIVELGVSQQGGQMCIDCDVKTQRLNLPERYVGSSAQAYEMFSKSRASIQRLKLHYEQRQGMAWIDLGQDAKLATEILNRIERQMARLQKEKGQ